jgi:hypothetical protein
MNTEERISRIEDALIDEHSKRLAAIRALERIDISGQTWTDALNVRWEESKMMLQAAGLVR